MRRDIILSCLGLILTANWALAQELTSVQDRDDFAKQMTGILDSTIDFGIVVAAKDTAHSVLSEGYGKANEAYVRSVFTDSRLGQLLKSKGFTAIVITNGTQAWTATPCSEGFCQPSGPLAASSSSDIATKSGSPPVVSSLVGTPISPSTSDEDFLMLANLQSRLSVMPMNDLASALQRLLFTVHMSKEAKERSAAVSFLSSEELNTSSRIHELLKGFPDYQFDRTKYTLPSALKAFSPATVVLRERTLQDLANRLANELATLPTYSSLAIDNASLVNAKGVLGESDFGRMVATLHDVDRGHYQLVELQTELERSRREVSVLAAKGLYYDGDEGVTVTVLRSRMQVITSTDANGYRRSTSGPLQRVIVGVGGPHPSDGITIGGGMGGVAPRTFNGHGATADLLCLEHCPILSIGSTYRLHLGRYITHESPHSGTEGYTYDNVPYLSLNGEQGLAAWQILEVCSGPSSGQCLALSTVNSRE